MFAFEFETQSSFAFELETHHAHPNSSASSAGATARACASANPKSSARAGANPTSSASAGANPSASASARAHPSASASASAHPSASAGAVANPVLRLADWQEIPPQTNLRLNELRNPLYSSGRGTSRPGAVSELLALRKKTENQKQEQNQTAVAGLLGWPIVTINPRSRGCLAETARIPARNCNKRSRKDLRPSKKRKDLQESVAIDAQGIR